ncbi:MAG: Gfo/Idh/MocA family oxidoreductase [bacterium]
MKPIRVGVIGLGMVAQIMHLHYLQDLDDFEIAAICDVSRKTLDYVGCCFGVSARYTDAAEMIRREKLDAVFILTFLHSDITKEAAQAGMHIFCEKPVAFSVKECDEMIRAVDRSGIVFMVGYMKRFDDGYLSGLEHFKAMKKSGDVRMIHVHDACFRNDLALKTMYQIRTFDDISKKLMVETENMIQKRLTEALGSAPKFVKQAYRMLLETGSHDITVLRGAFGDPEKILHTEIWPEGNWFSSTLDYGGNVRCLFDIARTARNWGDEHITAYGMTRTASVVFPIPFHRNAPTIVKLTGMDGDATAEQVIIPSYAESFRNELKHFADCVRKKKTPLTSIAEGRKDTELMTKIIKKHKA